MRTLTVIAAIGANLALGREGKLLWSLPGDMRHFKAVTMGGTVIMGRKTWESIGCALPGRTNVVVSRNPGLLLPEGVILKGSLQDALRSVAGDCYIIGGGQIYREAMALADTLNLTLVDDSPADADTFFPEIDSAVWTPAEEGELQTDPASGVKYRFVTYKRKQEVR